MLPFAPFIAALFLSDASPPSGGCEAHLGTRDTAFEVLPGQFICGRRGTEYSPLDSLVREARKRGPGGFYDSLLLDGDPEYRDKILIEGYRDYGRILIEPGRLTVWNRFLDKRYPSDSPFNRMALPIPPADFRTLDSLAGLIPGGAFGPDYMMFDSFFFCVHGAKQFRKAGGIETWGEPLEPLRPFWKVLDRLLKPYEDRRRPDPLGDSALELRREDPGGLKRPPFDSLKARSKGKRRKRSRGNPGVTDPASSPSITP
jgi:hypothetical protein